MYTIYSTYYHMNENSNHKSINCVILYKVTIIVVIDFKKASSSTDVCINEFPLLVHDLFVYNFVKTFYIFVKNWCNFVMYILDQIITQVEPTKLYNKPLFLPERWYPIIKFSVDIRHIADFYDTNTIFVRIKTAPWLATTKKLDNSITHWAVSALKGYFSARNWAFKCE